MFKFELSDPASKYTVSDEAFVRMVIIRQLGNLYPLDVNREGKLYNKIIKVVKEERLDKEKCDSAHTKVLRYLNLIVDGEVYHPIDDEGASDEAAEEYSLEFQNAAIVYGIHIDLVTDHANRVSILGQFDLIYIQF